MKTLITLEQVIKNKTQVIASVVEKRTILISNLVGEANWSGVVNFHCMQISLVVSIRFIFGDD